MLIRSVDPSRLVDAYDVKEQLFYPWPEVAATPFGSGWLVVEPGRRTKPHNHHEHETFFILRGQGMMTAGGESREVGPGDVVYLPPFGDHILENTSPRDDLHFLSIWWEDPAVLAGLKQPAAAGGRPQPSPLTLAVAVCAGGDRGPVAADLAGPCLGIEILARFARLQGARVRSVLDLAAAPAAAADGADADALALCERLQAAGEAALRSRPALYCEACRRHPAAGEVSGECGGCGRRISGAGSGCPGCGQPTCGGEALAGAVCGRCGGALVRRELTRLCFALAGHEEAVRRQYERTAMSPRLRALVDLALDRGLPELAISLPAEPVAASPPPGLHGQRFERWFARAARLLATASDAAVDAADALDAADAADPAADAADGPVVFLGLGEAFLYAVVLPALADAARATAYAPAALVEAEDYRAALAGFTASGGADGGAGAGEPPAEWRPWLRDLAQRLAEDHQGQAPPTQAWTREQQRFAGRLLRLAEEAAAAYQPATFSPVEAARRLGDLVRAASEFAAAEQPWRRVSSRTEERNTGVALELLAAKLLAQLAHPLLPEWSAALWRCLGYPSPLGEDGDGGNGGDGGEGSWEAVPSFVPTGSPIQGLEELAQARHAAATLAPARRRRRAPAGRARGAGRG
jgi:methionyl-tRNA synthetase